MRTTADELPGAVAAEESAAGPAVLRQVLSRSSGAEPPGGGASEQAAAPAVLAATFSAVPAERLSALLAPVWSIETRRRSAPASATRNPVAALVPTSGNPSPRTVIASSIVTSLVSA